MDQTALIDSIQTLHVTVPDTLWQECPKPTVPAAGTDVMEDLSFAIADEQARLCEKGRKDEAIGIIAKMNQAIGHLQDVDRTAVRDSKL